MRKTLRSRFAQSAIVVCASVLSTWACGEVTCEVTQINQWGSGYQAAVVVTNDGTSSVNGWEVKVTFAGAPNVTASWNADLNESGSSFTASNIAWNGNLAPGTTASFGFTGSSNGDIRVLSCASTAVSANSSSLVSSQPSTPSSSSVSSVASSESSWALPSSSPQAQCTEMCKWYQDDPRPLCQFLESGWGWENNTSCIGRSTCASQGGSGNIIQVCDGSSSSSDVPVSSISSAVSSSSSSSLSSSVVSSSSSVIVSSVSTGYSSSSASYMSTPSSGHGAVNIFTDLPDEMVITSDAERMEMGGYYQSKFFNDDEIETIYLNFAQNNYQQLLTDNYNSKTEIEATLTYKGKTYEQVGVRYRGMTSYMMAGNKKSFNIELDWAIEGQDINGYNTFKLNNGYEDPSNMREVLYNNLAIKNIPGAKASFAHLIVNGQDFGVYAKVQKLNKDHVKEWFFDKDNTRWRAESPASTGTNTGGWPVFGGGFGGWGDFGTGGIFGAGRSSLNDLGSNGSDYENEYTLKYSSVVDPWQDLADAAHIMGTASSNTLVEELSPYFDIDSALWMIATENVFTDDDSYINKGGMDYYVYFDVTTNRILPIEYDGNSVLGSAHVSSWTPFYNADNASYPLMNKLLAVPELRQRYLAHYRTLLQEALNPAAVNAKIDDYAALINNHVLQADVRQYSNAEYQSAVSSLKQSVESRYNFVSNNSEVNRQGPSITQVQDSVNGVASVRPNADQSVTVTAAVNATSGIRTVNLYYGEGLAGRFDKVAMQFDGSQYVATIPAFGKGSFVRYYVEAIADDGVGTASYSPVGAEHDVYIYQVISANYVTSSVVINEVMPVNKSVAVDEKGEHGDWIELYNKSSQEIDLSGYYLTDEEGNLDRWAFPAGTVIPARGTLIIWADDKADSTTGLHANFKLSASGENVYLVTPQLDFADSVTFVDAEDDKSFARSPNGTGNFAWTQESTFNAVNQ